MKQLTTSEQARADAMSDAETLLDRLRNNYLAAIEHTLLAVPIPSGHAALSRAHADIFSLVKHATAEIDLVRGIQR